MHRSGIIYNMDNNSAINEITAAKTAGDLFDNASVAKARIKYRKLTRSVHPDVFIESKDKQIAQVAFIKLMEFWDIYREKQTDSKLQNGRETDLIKTRKHEYIVVPHSEDDVFQIFGATYDAGHKRAEILIAKNTNDKDLVDAYINSIDVIKHNIPDEYKMFFPTIIEKFNYSAAGKNAKSSISLNGLKDFYTLREVVDKYPKGLHPRHVAWIFRRMLTAIGNSADVGLVHGAPNLDSFYINPYIHGVILKAWQYSVNTGSQLKAVPKNAKDYYPKYVFNKEPVDYKLDVWLTAKTAIRLLGDNEYKPFMAFFKGCLLSSVPEPRDLLSEFDAVMDKSFGERKFVTFDM